MKRLLAVLCALTLLASPAWAGRAVVIAPTNYPLQTESDDRISGGWSIQTAALNIMDQLGIDYDVIPEHAVKNAYCQDGVFSWNGSTRAYSLVVHLPGKTNRWKTAGGYFQDSLFRSTYRYTVPNVFVTQDGDMYGGANDSTTAKKATAGGDPWFWARYPSSDPTLRTFAESDEIITISRAALSGRTVRALVAGRVHNNNVMQRARSVGIYGPPAWPDSIWSTIGWVSNTDTAAVWSVTIDGNGSTAPLILLTMGHFPGVSHDYLNLVYALAHADSVSGGGLITKPIRFAIHMRGAFRRNAQHVPGGVVTADSVAVKAALDSIATLRFPITVGVQADSIASYPYEKAWWSRLPLVSYAPEVNVDAAATTARAEQVIRSQYATVRATWGWDRTDRTLMARLCDWIPGITTQYDSLSAMYLRLGNPSIVVNLKDLANSLKFWPNGLVSGGTRLRFLATPGWADSGSARYDNSFSAGGCCGSFYGFESMRKVSEFWRSALEGRMGGIGGGNILTTAEDSLDAGGGVYSQVFTLHASELGSGILSNSSTRPNRNAWWQLKYLVNGARIANTFGYRGKTIIAIVRSDEL